MYRVGIDIGGTFTDLFAWSDDQESAGSVRSAKVLSTPEDPSIGVLDALRKANIRPSEISVFIHGTTIVTNALLERSYPDAAMVTTAGFRDVIEIGRQRREKLYDAYQVKPKPLIRRRNRFTISEKLSSDGSVVVPLDEAAAHAAAEEISQRGIESVAVCFINAYSDDTHERKMREILWDTNPEMQVALSSETRPKMKELGRFSTTAIRAVMLSVVGDYMTNLEKKLAEDGCTAPTYIVKGNGGMMSSSLARQKPEELIGSGPAGGVAAAAYMSQVVSSKSMIITDVGGTSFEASLMENGRGLITDEYELEWEMPVIVPMLDIRSVGAGGGSIAWIDDGGSLRVGPQSAGADPGPACYGRGGRKPTVTDANLILGRISLDLGGKMELDRAAAEVAIETVARPLGMTNLECAEGIMNIVSEHMATAIRMVSTDRGRDPRDQTLVAFGGAGGLHAGEIAQALGIPEVLVPPYAGVACAVGGTTMDVRHDLEATFYAELDGMDWSTLNAAYEKLEGEASALMVTENVAPDAIILERTAAMRYIGQSYEVSTKIPSRVLGPADSDEIVAEFWRQHQLEYGVHSEEFPTAIVNIRLTAFGVTEKPSADDVVRAFGSQEADKMSLSETRTAYFGGSTYDVEVHNGAKLKADTQIVGPAIIEQTDGVIVVPINAIAVADRFGNVIIRFKEKNK